MADDDFKKLGVSPAMQKLINDATKNFDATKRMVANIPVNIKQAPPSINFTKPSKEDVNEYQSAAVFMKALADSALDWKESLPEGYAPAIIAILYGGIQITVDSLAQVSFHGIKISGSLNGAPCTMLAHQSTVQMICHAQEVSNEKPKNPIGFIWTDNEIEI